VITITILHTIARGNWRSINSEIAGNMTSEVRGFSDVTAAVANELKATSTARERDVN
jgi:hypothetical protein